MAGIDFLWKKNRYYKILYLNLKPYLQCNLRDSKINVLAYLMYIFRWRTTYIKSLNSKVGLRRLEGQQINYSETITSLDMNFRAINYCLVKRNSLYISALNFAFIRIPLYKALIQKDKYSLKTAMTT